MNTLSKLQSEAVKQIDDLNWDTDKGVMTKAKLIKQNTGETVGQITLPVTKEMIKTFVADQIQKAVEETRKDIIADVNLALINSRRMVQSPTGDFDVLDPKFLEEQLLSIQSKGKIK